jgi:serine/threonine-protein kinase
MEPRRHPRAIAPDVGTMLAGKYRVERVIGFGGMGIVVEATRIALEDRVAIKLLRAEATRSAGAVSRFLREARAAVKIRSEHVARVLDVGTLEDGAPYMALEYLEGRDLADVLAKDGPLSEGRVAEIVLQACEALAEAHAVGIVHRDVKPSNIFLTRRSDGRDLVKVLDFGISKTLDSTGSPQTKTHDILGSPAYMAPEQLKSARTVDRRADIWSLGVTLFELVTGQLPFPGETLAELHGAILYAAAPLLRTVRPSAPAGFEALIAKCIERDPDQRFQTVSELATALALFGPDGSREVAARIAKIDPAAAQEPAARRDMEELARAATLPASPPVPPLAHAATVAQTRTEWDTAVAPSPPATSARSRLVALGFAGLVLLAAAGVGVRSMLTSSQTVPSTSPRPSESIAPAPVPTPPVTVEASASAAAPLAPPPPAPVPLPSVTPVRHPPKAPPPPSAPPPRPVPTGLSPTREG